MHDEQIGCFLFNRISVLKKRTNNIFKENLKFKVCFVTTQMFWGFFASLCWHLQELLTCPKWDQFEEGSAFERYINTFILQRL